jgi:hypothetical protein
MTRVWDSAYRNRSRFSSAWAGRRPMTSPVGMTILLEPEHPGLKIETWATHSKSGGHSLTSTESAAGSGPSAEPSSVRDGQFLFQKLLLEQVGIVAVFGDQLVVCAQFHYAASDQYGDLIGVANRGNAVGNE